MEPETDAQTASGKADDRPRMPDPLPVWLTAVEDVRLPTPPGIEADLDAIYVELLQFEKVEGELAYHADNFTLRFEVMTERPMVHDSLRAQGIEILSLSEMEKKLVEREIDYTRQKGLTPGSETLLFLDPAGNWLEISERRLVP